jgi:hypothetical protein
MLGWASKHLDCTILFLTVIVNVICFFLIGLLLRVTNIPYRGPVFPPGTLDVLLPAFTSFAFDAQLLLADMFLIVGFNWILLKKHQSRVHLIYFIAFLVIDIPYFLTYIVEFNMPFFWWYLRGLIILIWLAGWSVLLLLKNKAAIITNKANL